MPISNARRVLRRHLVPCVALSATVFVSGCVAAGDERDVVASTGQASTSPSASTFPATYARQWMTNLTNSVRGDGTSPPVAARTYTYGAIAIYEAVVNGMPGYQSFGGQLNGLGELPKPSPGLTYDWPTVLAQTMNRVVLGSIYVFPLRLFFEFTTASEAALRALGPQQIAFRRLEGVPEDVSARSIAYANALADALIPWIDSDGYRAVRFKGWVPPEGPDKWVPTGFLDGEKVINPVEPWFGQLVRPLVLTSPDECKPPAPPPFSADKNSEFYKYAKEIHELDLKSTDEERDIARFWADSPVETATPPGHWVAIATREVRSKSLADAAFGYALSSLAYFDSFIAAWQSKYEYNLVRPITYIRRYINPDFQPLVPTPPFPSYVSGHSTASGTAGVVFTATFGSGPFVDDTKVRFGFEPRPYANYTEAAHEAARSRLYGGIHYRFDDDAGVAVGECVAEKILTRVALR